VCVVWTNTTAVTGSYKELASSVATGEVDPAQIDQACQQATDILYTLSGRQFPGACERTLRPVARPVAWTIREWTSYLRSVSGDWATWSDTWGACMGGMHNSCRNPPQIDLGIFPIRAIVQVKINGEVIPADEYRVDNGRLLTRVRPTISSQPTVRWGWPTCQDFTLPDTELNTFSVDVQYGMDPPVSGVAAANALAAELAKAHANKPNRLPARLTSITRQGVSMAVVDPMQFLEKGLTGVYEADIFIKSYNPQQQRRRPRVYSRDVEYTRTQGS
jgi:hypothetical protein